MKVLNKKNIVKRKQVEHTRTERRILEYTKHPFIGKIIKYFDKVVKVLFVIFDTDVVVGLIGAFQTPQRLFFILDYCPGGELFYHLTRIKKLPEKMTRFYAAEIVLALDHLHRLGVIYRYAMM